MTKFLSSGSETSQVLLLITVFGLSVIIIASVHLLLLQGKAGWQCEVGAVCREAGRGMCCHCWRWQDDQGPCSLDLWSQVSFEVLTLVSGFSIPLLLETFQETLMFCIHAQESYDSLSELLALPSLPSLIWNCDKGRVWATLLCKLFWVPHIDTPGYMLQCPWAIHLTVRAWVLYKWYGQTQQMASGLVAESMQAYINRKLLSEVTNWSTIATLNSTWDFIKSLVQFFINSVLLLLFFLHIFPWSTARSC